MALNDAALDVAGDALAAALVGISFHTADPGAAGTSAVIAGGRAAIVMASTNGDLALTAPVTKTGLTPGATVAFLGLWSTSTTGGTYYGSVPRTTGDATVNTNGEYTANTLVIPSSSS
jgi:hypothetical protein